MFILFRISCDCFSLVEGNLRPIAFLICAFEFPVSWCSSLCLYNITSFFFLQDGILYKVTVLYLCNIQIYAYQRHISLTSDSGYDMITMLGGLEPGRPFSRYFCCSSQIRSTAISAGLTPEIRPACPMDMGRISESFSFASRRRPTMEL